MNVDYSRISPDELEQIWADIMEAEWYLKIKGKTEALQYIQSFSEGKDWWIDGRIDTQEDENAVVIQCKRYKDWDSLYSSAKDEKEKMDKINPSRYIFMTSFDLSKERVDKIFDRFDGHIKSKKDVWWKQALDHFLEKHPHILDNHIKLWLDSATILRRIINSWTHHNNIILKEDIESKIKVFVENEGSRKVHDILKESNYCIISWVPGIGKTTLAEMTAYRYMHNGYDVINITRDIKEWTDLLVDDDSKQFFYYDDFLWEDLLADGLRWSGEDAWIVSFVRRIQWLKNKKAIFTTREYILQQAWWKYNKFDTHGFIDDRFTLNIKEYTIDHKVRILYNIMYFSNLSENIRKDIVEKQLYTKLFWRNNKEYEKSIFLKKFNPKMISILFSAKRLQKENFVSGEECISKLYSILDDHYELYKSVFLDKISESSRSVILAIFTFWGSHKIHEVKEHWKILQEQKRLSSTDSDWHNSLREIEWTFTITHYPQSHWLDGRVHTHTSPESKIIHFLDPFIKDFISTYLDKNTDTFKDLLVSSKSWWQIRTLTAYIIPFTALYSFIHSKDSWTQEILIRQYKEAPGSSKIDKLQLLFKFPYCLNFVIEEMIWMIEAEYSFENYWMLLKMAIQLDEERNFPHQMLIAHFLTQMQDIRESKESLKDEVDIFSPEITQELMQDYFTRNDQDYWEFKILVESELDESSDMVSNVRSMMPTSVTDLWEYTNDDFDKESEIAEILWNFIGDRRVFDDLEEIREQLQSMHDEEFDQDDREEYWKDMRWNKNWGFDKYDELFQKLV